MKVCTPDHFEHEGKYQKFGDIVKSFENKPSFYRISGDRVITHGDGGESELFFPVWVHEVSLRGISFPKASLLIPKIEASSSHPGCHQNQCQEASPCVGQKK